MSSRQSCRRHDTQHNGTQHYINIRDTQHNGTRLCYAEYPKHSRYAECRYAECRNAECRYAECNGTTVSGQAVQSSTTNIISTATHTLSQYNRQASSASL
jgi:hypothetical protein